jgi:hypothetical protein
MASVSFREESHPDRTEGEARSANLNSDAKDDYHEQLLRKEAERVLKVEPEMSSLLRCTVLAPGVRTFEDAVATTLCVRLLTTRRREVAASPPPSFTI